MKKFIAGLFFLFGSALHAEENPLEVEFFGSFLHSVEVPNALFVFSEIAQNDSFELRRALRTHDIDTIILASNGGSVWEGLTMAGVIFDRQMTTYVPNLPNRQGCFSACAFMFFAGKNRLSEGELGVHQVGNYDEDLDGQKRRMGETQQVTQFTTSEIIGFLNEFATPPWVYERMFRSRELYFFSNEEKADLNFGNLDEAKKQKIDAFLDQLLNEIQKINSEELKETNKFTSIDTDDREAVQSFQTLLNEAKCSAGSSDGLWGRRTNAAAGRFAKANKLEYSGPASVNKQYLQVLLSADRADCPPLPPPPKLAKLPSSWTFSVICSGRRMEGYANFSLQRRGNEADYYRVTYSNTAGGKYAGSVKRMASRFTFEMRQTNGSDASTGNGNISQNSRSIRGTTDKGCNFIASAG